MAFSTIGSAAWETSALERSLHSARARSMERSHRIVAAARTLADESGSAGFTVAQVAERAGLSLKSVYRSFAGKDEILLALLEEESGIGARLLAPAIERHDGPIARVHAFIAGMFDFLTHPGAVGYAGVLVREDRRLAEHHPAELRTALAPLVDLLAAQIAGAVDDDVDVPRAADTVFAVVLDGIAEVTHGGADPATTAEWVVRFCAGGLGLERQDRRDRP
jgi:AcrR family transcriptional regulator